MTAAKILLDCRKERGLSQQQLASQIGVARQRISEWEQGIKEPGFKNVERVVAVLGFDISVVKCGDAA